MKKWILPVAAGILLLPILLFVISWFYIAIIAFSGGHILSEDLAGAAWSGDEAKVKLLLSEGVDPESTFEGETALELAKEGHHPKIVKMLKDAGAKQ